MPSRTKNEPGNNASFQARAKEVALPAHLTLEEQQYFRLWMETTTGQWTAVHETAHSYLILDSTKADLDQQEGQDLVQEGREQNEAVLLYDHGGIDEDHGMVEFHANLDFMAEAHRQVPILLFKLSNARILLETAARLIKKENLYQTDINARLFVKLAEEQLGFKVTRVVEDEE